MKTSYLPRVAAPVILLLAFAVGWETRSSAAIIAADSFEEYSPGPLSGAGGGMGWAGPWGAPASTAIANVVDASASPLTFTPAGGLTADGTNVAVEVYSNPLANAVAAARQISGPLPDVFYVSYLVRVEAGTWATAATGANTFSIHLANTAANTTSINFGLRGAATGGEIMVRSGTGTPVANASAGGQVETGTNFLLVARLSKLGTVGTPTATYDRVEIWSNPAAAANLTAPTGNARLQLADGTGLGTLSHVIVRQAALEAEDRVWFDRLVIGNSWEDVVPLEPDTNAPVVAITSPASNSVYGPGVPVDVSATVTEDRNLVSVQLLTNSVFALADNVAPHLFSLTNLPIGQHTLTVLAADGAGNLGSNSISLLVTNDTGDVVPPVVSINSPTNGAQFLINTLVSVSATVTDNVAVAYTELYADAVWQRTDSQLPYVFSLTNLVAGPHTLSVRGVDLSGNAATNSVSITIITNTPEFVGQVIIADTFNGTAQTGLVAPLTYTNTGIDLPSTGTLTPSIANNTAPAGALSVSVLYSGTLTGNQDFDGSYSFTKDGSAAFNFGTNLAGKRWSLAFTARTTGTTAVDKFYVGVSDTNSCLVESDWDIAIQMGTGTATNDGQGLKVIANGNVKRNIPNPTTALSGGVLHSYVLTVDETGAQPAYALDMDGTNVFAPGTTFGAFSTPDRFVVFNIFDRTPTGGGVNVGQLNDVTLSVLLPPGPPETKFYSCTALPGFFAGLNLFLTNSGGLNLLVWSSPDAGVAVTNWALEGTMVETPLNDETGNSRYALNVVPAVSPTYYLISTTNTPPYAGLPVPVQWLTTPDNVDYTFHSTNTTISTSAVLGIAPPPMLVVPVIGGVVANPDYSFTLNVSVAAGQTYRLLAATNLVPPVIWEPVLTNISATTNLTPVVDSNAVSHPTRFYRLVSP